MISPKAAALKSALLAKLMSGNRPENYPPEPPPAQQQGGGVAGTAGSVAGTATGGYAASQLLPSTTTTTTPALTTTPATALGTTTPSTIPAVTAGPMPAGMSVVPSASIPASAVPVANGASIPESYAGYSSATSPFEGSGFASTGTEPISAAANESYMGGASLASQGGALSGLAPVGSDFAAMGTLGQVALPAAGAYGAYNLGSNLINEHKAGTVGGATSGAAMGATIGSFVPVPGATFIGAGIGGLAGALLGNVGHGHHFYEAQDRNNQIKQFAGGGDTFSLPTANGGTFSVTRKQFEDDPNYYNLREGVGPTEIAQANQLLGVDPTKAGTLANQTVALVANMIHAGVKPDVIAQHLSGGGQSKPAGWSATQPANWSATPPSSGPLGVNLPAAQQAFNHLSGGGLLSSGKPAQPGKPMLSSSYADRPSAVKSGGSYVHHLPAPQGNTSAVRPTLDSFAAVPRGPQQSAPLPQQKAPTKLDLAAALRRNSPTAYRTGFINR